MTKTTNSYRIAKFLKDNKGKKYEVREIAQNLIELYPDIYEDKGKKTSKYGKELEEQVRSEIYSKHEELTKLGISWDSYPKPRRYYYSEDIENNENTIDSNNISSSFNLENNNSENLYESELYKPFIDFLKNSYNLRATRINEKITSDIKYRNRNRWLHPDIVAYESLIDNFHSSIKESYKDFYYNPVKLWSFEIKVNINKHNIREAYFQAVSNSVWANEGYLVATNIDKEADKELRSLSSVYGIGVILFTPNDVSQSDIIIPSKQRSEIDWNMINRLFTINEDFQKFMTNVKVYTRTSVHKND